MMNFNSGYTAMGMFKFPFKLEVPNVPSSIVMSHNKQELAQISYYLRAQIIPVDNRNMMTDELSNFGCVRRIVVARMPTKPHSSSRSLIPQKREEGAAIGYSGNQGLISNIE